VKRKYIVVLAISALAVTGMMGLASADFIPDGPAIVHGFVYKSDGTHATTADANPSTVTVTLVVLDSDYREHGRYTETLEEGANGYLIYSITIQPADYRSAWPYYLEIDGTKWGDVNYKTQDPQRPGEFEWSLAEGVVERDVQTLSEIPQNFKPIIAIVFIIIIFLLGILMIGVVNRQKVDVVIMNKRRVTDKKGNIVWDYTCVYGDMEEPVEMGAVSSQFDFGPNSIVRVSANKIIRTYQGKYTWFRPKVVDMAKIPQDQKPTEPSTKKSIENKWFKGGCISTVEGQMVESAVRRYKTFVFSSMVMPFILAEIIIGALSVEVEALAIPPWLGAGLIINIVILLVAIILQTVYCVRSIGKEKEKEPTPSKEVIMVTPKETKEEPPEETKTEPEEVITPEEETKPSEPAAEEPAEEAAPILCPNCGEEVLPDYMLCPHCKAKLK
jgi:flagellar basal body-associated protein FliL